MWLYLSYHLKAHGDSYSSLETKVQNLRQYTDRCGEKTQPRKTTYLKRAFSAPKICTVEAGYLARLVRLPAWAIKRAATCKTSIDTTLR